MSTGPDPAGQHRRAEDSAPDYDGVAEVFARFTLDSDRKRGRRRKRAQEGPGPKSSPEPQPAAEPGGIPPSQQSWPNADTGDGGVRAVSSPDQAPAEEPGRNQATYIRPYAWTGGRTKSTHRLELETLVSVSEMCRPERLQRTEHHTIAGICQHPRSVAEIGARLEVPLGVAKVLVGDMADLGLITVHDTVSDNTSSSHFLLMERVLSGLRRL